MKSECFFLSRLTFSLIHSLSHSLLLPSLSLHLLPHSLLLPSLSLHLLPHSHPSHPSLFTYFLTHIPPIPLSSLTSSLTSLPSLSLSSSHPLLIPLVTPSPTPSLTLLTHFQPSLCLLYFFVALCCYINLTICINRTTFKTKKKKPLNVHNIQNLVRYFFIWNKYGKMMKMYSMKPTFLLFILIC